jgi:hypothetical protein
LLSFVTEAFYRSQNLIGRLRPFEGLWAFVVQVDEGTDIGLEPPEGGMNASLDLLSGGFSEPAFRFD